MRSQHKLNDQNEKSSITTLPASDFVDDTLTPTSSRYKAVDEVETGSLEEELENDFLDDNDFKKTDSSEWIPYTDRASDGPFYLNKTLFAKGLIVFSDRHEEDIKETGFQYGSRMLKFTTLREKEKKNTSQVTSSARIFSQLQLFIERTSIEQEKKGQQEIKDSLEKHFVEKIINLVYQYYTSDLTIDKNNLSVITTENRSDEIFFPFGFVNKAKSRLTGLYGYPWPSLVTPGTQVKEEFIKEFKGFTDFFTGSCLLGTTLQGIDVYENSFSLIKADLQLYPGQKIHKINCEKSLQFHEIVQLKELEKLASLAISLSKENSEKINIYYHIPSYDYLLVVGVELYIKGHITPEAFESFCSIVLKRQETYDNIIKKISLKYDVNICTVSPFKSFFKNLPNPRKEASVLEKTSSTSKEAEKPLGKAVLAALGLDSIEEIEIKKNISEDTLKTMRNDIEKEAVQKCIEIIMDKKRHDSETSWIVWKDFIENAEKPIATLKDLSHIGNTVMLGIIAYNKKPFSICGFHPITEKHIFVQYGKYIKNKNLMNKKYPVILCLTTVDSVQPHSKLYRKNRGQTFYYNRRAAFLVRTSTQEEKNEPLELIEKAGSNVTRHAACSPPSSQLIK